MSELLELERDLSDFEDFEVLPSGDYPAEVTSAEMRVSNNGNPYYYCVLRIAPEDYPPDYSLDNNPEGTNLVFARLQRPDAKNRRSITAVKNFYKALGLSTKVSTINPGEWEGQKTKLTIKEEDWNGSPINSIVAIEALD